MSIRHLRSYEAKAFVPSDDFEFSKRFYQDFGFSLQWSSSGLALFRHGTSGFFLEDRRDPELLRSFKMHLLVDNVDRWWAALQYLVLRYGLHCDPPTDKPRGARDFVLFDPSGVLWRIGELPPAAR